MRKLFPVLVALLMAFPLWPQQFFTDELPLLSSPPYFVPGFILQHNVKEITASIAYKDDNRPIVFTPFGWKMRFSKNGYVREYVRTFEEAGRESELSHLYFFDSFGKLQTIFITYPDHTRKTRRIYYDSHGNIIKKTLESVNGKTVYEKEEFKYEYYTSRQFKQFALNDEGLTYKYTIVNLDSAGRVASKTSRYIRGGYKTESFIWRNEKGRVTEFYEERREPDLESTRIVLTYDAEGRLLSEDRFANGKKTLHTEILYNDKGLPVDLLQRDENTGRITIIRLTYTYWKG